MNRMIGVVLAVAACAAIAAGSARAESTDWCGQAEGTCDTSLAYIQCSDGTVWVLDQTWSASDFGEAVCDGYTVLSPPTDQGQSSDDSSDSSLAIASDMAPDPVQYVTEIQCPNGQTWAVASGDDFVCPAA